MYVKMQLIPVIRNRSGDLPYLFDEYGDNEKGKAVINNAKTRRVSVCNALDCLVIHESRLDDLGYIVELCRDSDVIIYADETFNALKENIRKSFLKRQRQNHSEREYLSYKMAGKNCFFVQ